MKRVVLGLMMVVLGAALFAPTAQAAPKLTMNEARMEILTYGVATPRGHTFYFGSSARHCSRLASNRIRCSVRFSFETTPTTLKDCVDRVEVVEHAEIKVSLLRRHCSKRKISYLSYTRAEKAAKKAMDPKSSHPNYAMGFGGGSIGKGYRFDATWVNEKDQTCLQTAKVRLVKKKIRVTVSDIACVNDPDWPTA
jgi:Ulp1 family protease